MSEVLSSSLEFSCSSPTVYFRCLEMVAKRAGLAFEAVDQTMKALLLRWMLIF